MSVERFWSLIIDMKHLLCLLSLLSGCLIGNAQITTKQIIIVRDSVGSIISVNEEEYRDNKIVRSIYSIVDESGCMIPSYEIEYTQLNNKDYVDSVLTYYVYKGADSIQDKIVSFSFDVKKKLLMAQTIKYVNKIDVVYPSVQLTVFKYNRMGKVAKVKYCQKNGDKITCDYIDKVSYKDKDVIVRRFFLPSYNNKGKKVLIPRKEYEFSLLSTIDDNNRVLYQKEKRFSKSDTVNKIVLETPTSPYISIYQWNAPPDKGTEYTDYYNTETKALEIPGQIKIDETTTYPVKVINKAAFANKADDIYSLKFNSGLVQICKEAFLKDTEIKSIDFTNCDTLLEISNDIFNQRLGTRNSYVRSLELPHTLEYIGMYMIQIKNLI